jgi:hypothetical protein
MENSMIPNPTSRTQTDLSSTSGFAMPTRGCAIAFVGLASIPATGLSTGTVIRDRQDDAAKGHVGLVAYVPGNPAWSPPIC